MLTMGNMLQIPIVKNRNVAVNEGGKEGEGSSSYGPQSFGG